MCYKPVKSSSWENEMYNVKNVHKHSITMLALAASELGTWICAPTLWWAMGAELPMEECSKTHAERGSVAQEQVILAISRQ